MSLEKRAYFKRASSFPERGTWMAKVHAHSWSGKCKLENKIPAYAHKISKKKIGSLATSRIGGNVEFQTHT